MEKAFRIMEIAFMVCFLLLGLASIIGGIITGKWHCFLLAAMTAVLPCVWYYEDKKEREK